MNERDWFFLLVGLPLIIIAAVVLGPFALLLGGGNIGGE